MLLDQILFHVPCPIFWKNIDGVFLGCNKAFLTLAGFYDYNQLLGKTDAELPWKKYKEKYYKDDQYIIASGKTLVEVEYIPLDGHTILSETTKAPLILDGKITGVLGIIIDITAQKEAERIKSENERNRIIQQEKFKKSVGQMIHDIQSPLFSLNSLLLDVNSNFPENTRNILRTAIASITDITGHLLNRYKNENIVKNEQKQPVLVSEVLLQIISEKRYAYRNQQIAFQIEFAPDSEFSFILIEPTAFKRMLFNLINNAVDALEDKVDNKLELCLNADHEQIILYVKDNGKGMSQESISKIKQNLKFSEGKKNGHGLGLMQVIDTVEDNNGTLDVNSILGFGTTMTVKFPRISMPNWVADEIIIAKDNIIVILDDDESIHYAWDDKFKSIIEQSPEIQIKHFKGGLEVIEYINNCSDTEKAKVYLLTDYELLEQKINGIDVIQQTGVKRAILVTSHYTDSRIRDLAINSQIQLLPKNLAFAVKIKIRNIV